MPLPEVGGWITEPAIRWFQRCERCGRWRLVGYYFEVYSLANCEHPCWWYECLWCFVDTITQEAERDST